MLSDEYSKLFNATYFAAVSNFIEDFYWYDTTAQWSGSLGRGDKAFSKSLEGCSMDMFS